MATIRHQAARTAFGAVADMLIKNIQDADKREKGLLKAVDLTQSFAKDRFPEENYEKARDMIRDRDGKWMQYIDRICREVHPNVLKRTTMNLGFEAMLSGAKIMKENREKYQCNIPWLLLIDPTSACNLHCTGCWAAEYGHTMALTYEEMDSIVTQGKELGIYLYMFTGGEPLVRKKDLIRLCEKHDDCIFHSFTNGTLVDEEFCQEMDRVGNLSLSISLEGYEEVNDGRRGAGTFDRVMEAMDLLKAHGQIFGVSICYTRANVETVTSDEFLDMIIEKGCRYAWYFHYMPVGNAASTDLLPTPEQREYMYHRVREIRGMTGGKSIFAFDFQNDGEYVHGCIAGGKNYCHINANGDVEPCVFVHYSGANIREVSLLDALRQPLFMEYYHGQPFNENHLRPCPMLENPEKLRAMVARSGAKSTDLESPESVEHLCAKCDAYAQNWCGKAEELWDKSGKAGKTK